MAFLHHQSDDQIDGYNDPRNDEEFLMADSKEYVDLYQDQRL